MSSFNQLNYIKIIRLGLMLLLLVILISSAGWLYYYGYQTLTQLPPVLALRQQASFDLVDLEKLTAVTDRLTAKTADQSLDWTGLRNPF